MANCSPYHMTEQLKGHKSQSYGSNNEDSIMVFSNQNFSNNSQFSQQSRDDEESKINVSTRPRVHLSETKALTALSPTTTLKKHKLPHFNSTKNLLRRSRSQKRQDNNSDTKKRIRMELASI